MGRIRVDQKLGLNGVAARLLICELKQAAAQVDDLCRQVAGRLAELGGLAFVIEQGVLLPGQGLALGGEAFRLVGLRRADHFN